MAESCPDCGTPIELASQPVTARTGTCAACSRIYMILEGAKPPEAGTGSPAASADADAPACDSCGSTLRFEARGPGGFRSVCPGCGTRVEYVRSDAPDRPIRSRAPPSGAGANSRPCRECGGPLQFTTNPDGSVTGECASCGNRFTMPQRRDDRGGGPPGRFGRGGPPGRFGDRGRRGPWQDRGGGGGGPRRFGGYQGRRGRDEGSSSGDDDERSEYRRRRRPRDE